MSKGTAARGEAEREKESDDEEREREREVHRAWTALTEAM